MSFVVCCVHAGVRVLRACKGTFQCCMHGAYVCLFVSAYVRVSGSRQHACVCTCQCCTPTCVRVLRACMCTCGVRLHVSRLAFSSLVIRFSSRWIRNQGPPVYHQTPPPLSRQPPSAEPPAPAARGRPALPETTPHRRSTAAPAIPLAPLPPPAPNFFSGDPHPTAQ